MDSEQELLIEKETSWLQEYGINIEKEACKTINDGDTPPQELCWLQTNTSKIYIAELDGCPEDEIISDKKIAVKVSLFPYSKTDSIMRELELLNTLDHEHIIKPIHPIPTTNCEEKTDAKPVKEPKKAYLVTDFHSKGDLCMNITKNGAFEESQAREYFVQILNAVKYLHKQDIVHRDIKLQNVLMVEEGKIQLIDFGFACKLNLDEVESEKSLISCLSDIKGTQGYISPEILEAKTKIGNHLEDNQFSDCTIPQFLINLKKSDIFALGVILFEMVLGIPPFMSANPRDPCYRNFYFKKREHRFWGVHPKSRELDAKGLLSEEFKSLIQGILTPFPDLRLSLEEIEDHPWMKLSHLDLNQ